MSRTALTALGLGLALAAPVSAQAVLEDVVRAEVLPGWTTRSGTRMAGLRLSLAPGWKTYWRAPGDAGIPPMFSWSGSDNVKSVGTFWPTPSVFDTSGFRTIGYEGDVILPLEFHPREASTPMTIEGKIDLGVCETICVPVSLTFSAELSGKGASHPDIQQALADQPVDGDRAGVRKAVCRFEPISDGLRVTANIQMPKIGRQEVAVVEAGDAQIWVSEAETVRSGQTLTVAADLVPPRGVAPAVDRSGLRFTILGDRQAVDIRGCTAS